MSNYFKVQDGLELHNDVVVVDGAINPSSVGYAAPQGSLYCQTNGDVWRKYGAGDTDWSRIEILVTGTASDQDASSGLAVDSVAVADYAAIKWFLMVKSNATPANRRAYEVYGLNDDSTGIDYTAYAVLKVNTKPSNLQISVDIDSGNMRLIVTASENIDYSWVRIPVIDI